MLAIMIYRFRLWFRRTFRGGCPSCETGFMRDAGPERRAELLGSIWMDAARGRVRECDRCGWLSMSVTKSIGHG